MAMFVAVATSCTEEAKIDTRRQLDYCASQVERSLQAMHVGDTTDYSRSPRDILDGQRDWNLQPLEPQNWTWGFWPGILWMDYAYTKNESIRQEAERFTAPLACLATREPYDHDLGFLVFLSHEKAYRLTGDEKYKDVIVATARQLAKLYNPKVGTILSWPREATGTGAYQPHNTIIDNMINLEMLFWAAEHGGGSELRDIAVSHANTTMKNQFRPDGTADGSVWSRGQAWAVYGFTMCYRMTKDTRYLDTAQKAADAYLERLPADYVPYWDFSDPAIPDAPRDASAASIAASALLELQTYLDGDKAVHYHDAALKMLRSLSSEQYQSREKNTAFLLHSTGNRPANSQIDCSIVYADYYYMEALLRLRELEKGRQ